MLILEHLKRCKIAHARSEILFLQIVSYISNAVLYLFQCSDVSLMMTLQS
jgi:hypothetical protein